MRAFVSGFFTLIIMFYCATDMVPLFVKAAIAANPTVYAHTGNFTSICDGSNPMTWAIVRFAGLGWIGIAVVAAIAITMSVINFRNIKKL